MKLLRLCYLRIPIYWIQIQTFCWYGFGSRLFLNPDPIRIWMPTKVNKDTEHCLLSKIVIYVFLSPYKKHLGSRRSLHPNRTLFIFFLFGGHVSFLPGLDMDPDFQSGSADSLNPNPIPDPKPWFEDQDPGRVQISGLRCSNPAKW